LNPRPDSFSVVSREPKRPRFSTQRQPLQIRKEEKARPRSRQESRESSVFSISSTTTTATNVTITSPETTKSNEDMVLIAKCVQYEFLCNETKRHFENLKQTAEVHTYKWIVYRRDDLRISGLERIGYGRGCSERKKKARSTYIKRADQG
jgi:hypothetical protein